MNATVILVEMAVFAALFTIGVLVENRGDKKYTSAAIPWTRPTTRSGSI
ncbi:MAG: hypothetical protein Q4G41_05610 [Coriobacteriales bacterium]|nr:hypothetical protein [Coriobacteriales bacterium]